MTTESFFVFVAVDGDRQPVAVPSLEVSSERGDQLRDRALDAEAGCRRDR